MKDVDEDGREDARTVKWKNKGEEGEEERREETTQQWRGA
jgi:hypothetical protein